jgi:hypothetical protein
LPALFSVNQSRINEGKQLFFLIDHHPLPNQWKESIISGLFQQSQDVFLDAPILVFVRIFFMEYHR